MSETFPSHTGHPEGDAAAWKQRYSPSIAEVIRHSQPEAPLFSVILVAWQSADVLLDGLAHLRNQRGVERSDVEIVLVDNGGLESILPRLSEYVDLHIRMHHNVGIGPARNVGTAYARGPLLSFVEDDGLVDDNYFDAARRHFEKNRDIVALRGRIFAKDHPYFSTVAVQYDRGDQVLDDCLVTEGNSMVRRAELMQAGGFSDILSPHEGVEVSFRLKASHPGSRIVYVPDVVMRHDFCETWRQFFRKSFYYPTTREVFADSDPDCRTFVYEFLSRRYPLGERPLDQKVARTFLQTIRGSVQRVARLRSARKRRYIRAQS